MAEWMEDNTEMHFKSVPLPDYNISREGASISRTMLTKEFDGRRLGNRIEELRYPIQGYSTFGSMQADPEELPVASVISSTTQREFFNTLAIFCVMVRARSW